MSNIELENSLNREEIEQLNKTVSSFSTQSFELKKFCVTIEVSACTLLATVFNENFSSPDFLSGIKLTMLLIPSLFYIVDIITYYYQDKLRCAIFNIENSIRKRNGLKLKNDDRFLGKKSRVFPRLIRSIKNTSHIIYWGLILLAIAFSIRF